MTPRPNLGAVSSTCVQGPCCLSVHVILKGHHVLWISGVCFLIISLAIFQYFRRTVKMTEKESAARKLKMQMWTNVVTIVLVEGSDLIPMDDNGLSDPYVKFKLGNEKYKSKVCLVHAINSEKGENLMLCLFLC